MTTLVCHRAVRGAAGALPRRPLPSGDPSLPPARTAPSRAGGGGGGGAGPASAAARRRLGRAHPPRLGANYKVAAAAASPGTAREGEAGAPRPAVQPAAPRRPDHHRDGETRACPRPRPLLPQPPRPLPLTPAFSSPFQCPGWDSASPTDPAAPSEQHPRECTWPGPLLGRAPLGPPACPLGCIPPRLFARGSHLSSCV